MSAVVSLNPRTGAVRQLLGEEASPNDVSATAGAAAAAAPELQRLGRTGRASMLRLMAEGLEADAAGIVEVADAETALGAPRLRGELGRTTYQLRLFADALDEGSYVEATIEHPRETALGPQPDLRRMLVPLGPVAVFGSSNFPLAFSVGGGDTASALAAGCPVVVKAHPSHPATSERTYAVLAKAASAAGAPDGAIGLVHGHHAGAILVQRGEITAVAFTGSQRGGRALLDLVNARPDPIPFYGELGSVNPLVVSPGAARTRAAGIGTGLAQALTQGAGQFCTKPGLAFVPAGEDGDRLCAELAHRLTELAEPLVVANQGIRDAYFDQVAALSRHQDVACLVDAVRPGGAGFAVAPHVLSVGTTQLDQSLLEEVFGPYGLIVRYGTEDDLLAALRLLEPALAGAVHSEADEVEFTRAAFTALAERAGRILWNSYPPGMAVTWATQHGAGWPAATAPHTSVGVTAVRRFLRPVCWQDVPPELLPEELREDNVAGIPRRVDGKLSVGY
ncbi:aldehyde dehydrogenase family protein [Prauserella flavalba]|uniref:Aldehyde dehydrogenase n=1 Tax=Prauserella flavalba TaxID=1477506 RepID=A0A318LB52_9PSEU|nr:aldehyde dehydrogenase family protein [Prauserella flavalba]PXY18573.1 aldehyde dehydrogenase [Prauserella flavalba]